mgnify:CR=1 FL=1
MKIFQYFPRSLDKSFPLFVNLQPISMKVYLRSETSPSNIKHKYDQEAIREYIDFLNHKNIKVKCLKDIDELVDMCKPKKTIICDYPGVGYQLDKINEFSKNYDIEFKFIYDRYDLMCWPYARAGYFKFKKQIPFFLENIHN